MLAPFQALNFTGMGGPMGVYEPYDTDKCDPGGTHCVARDNEANYARPGLSAILCQALATSCGLQTITVLMVVGRRGRWRGLESAITAPACRRAARAKRRQEGQERRAG